MRRLFLRRWSSSRCTFQRPPRDDSYFPHSFSKRVLCGGESHRKPALRLSAVRAPIYRVRADEVDVLHTPAAFYDTLLALAGRARRRVSLASLYLGTGAKERELMRVLEARCLAAHGKDASFGNGDDRGLTVNIVLDRNRGTRPDVTYHDDADGNRVQTIGESAASILAPAVERCAPGAFNLGLFDMPLPEGDVLTRLVLPHLGARYNEILHTFHLKAYVFDDTLVMSGANLSNDYFTARQDRYWVFRSSELANFYHDLLEELSKASRPYDCGPRTPAEPFLPFSHYADLQQRIQHLMFPQAQSQSALFESDEDDNDDQCGTDEWVFVQPSVQCASLGFRIDETLTLALFERLDDLTDLQKKNPSEFGPKGKPLDTVYKTAWLSTGYLNLHDSFRSHLFSMRTTPVHVLVAAPSANGFFTAKGIAGSLPMAYSLMEKRLYRAAVSRGLIDDLAFSIAEYEREGWTYHAKGLWFLEKGVGTEAEGKSGGRIVEGMKEYKTGDEDMDKWHTGPTFSEDVKHGLDTNEDKWRTGPTFDAATMGYGVRANTSLARVKPGLESGGALTLVGSPNFGFRSVERDFESQLLVVTDNAALAEKMRRELSENILLHTTDVDDQTWAQPERKLSWSPFRWKDGWWISPASLLVRYFM